MLKKRVAELERGIRFRSRLIIGLFGLVFFLIIGWNNAQTDITLHYPPDLRSGASMKVGQIDPSEVFGFVSTVFTYLNTWNENGLHDYPANRKKLRAYLTQKYQRYILAEIKDLERLGEIQGRTRTIQPIAEDYYTEDKVTIKNGSTWVVLRKFRVKEYIKGTGTPIKDTVIEFPIRVVVYTVPRQANPWQLGLDGYEREPTRVPYLKGDLD